MGRIRTIKPELLKHYELFKLEQETGLPIRIAFAGLFTVADREGRFKWRPEELKTDVLPYDDVPFSRVLDALATRGFVVKYACGTRDYGVIPSFPRHQQINARERQSEIPSPDEGEIYSYENVEISDASPTSASRVTHASVTGEPRVSDASPTREPNARGEGKGKERKGTGREGETKMRACARETDSKKPNGVYQGINRHEQKPEPQEGYTELWERGLFLLTNKCGMELDQARGFIGSQLKKYLAVDVMQAIDEVAAEQPQHPFGALVNKLKEASRVRPDSQPP